MPSEQHPKQVILTRDEIKELITATVKDTLTSLGVDVSNPMAMQRDLQTVREFRVAIEAIKKQGLLAAVGVVVTGLLAVLGLGIKSWLTKAP